MAPDQVLEIAPGGDARLDRGERRLEGERRQRIAIVQPGGQCAQNINAMPRGNEPVLFSRRRNSTVLSAASTVSRIDAVSGELAERVVRISALDLVGVGGIDALEADRERRLAQDVGQAGAGQTLRQPGIDQRLVAAARPGVPSRMCSRTLEAECRSRRR